MSKKKELRIKWLKKQRSKAYAKEKYGEVTDSKRMKMLKENAERMRNKMTKPEKTMSEILTSLEIEHEAQKIVAFFIYDFFVPKYKLLIEVDGDYYHGHPDKYEPKDLNWGQKKAKSNDVKKSKLAKAFKYHMLRFWESDINNKPKEVTKKIKQYIDENFSETEGE